MRKLLLFTILGIVCSCKQQIRDNKEIDDIYEKLFRKNVNLQEKIKDSIKNRGYSKFRIFPKTIKSGILISIVTSDERKDKSDFCFLVYNLKEEKILWLINNPFSDIGSQQIEYDFDNDVIVAYSPKDLPQLYYYNCSKKTTSRLSLKDGDLNTDPGNILLDNNLIYFTQSPLGSYVYNIEKKGSFSFRNTHADIISYIYSSIAIPITDSVNLISGKKENGAISAVVVDSSFKIRSRFNIAEDNSASNGFFKMLSYNEGYAIFNRKKCFFLDKGLLPKWELSYTGNLKNAFSLNDQSLFCAVSDSGVTKLLCINAYNGEVTWSKEFPIRIAVNQDVVVNKISNSIVIAGTDKIWILDFLGSEKQAISLNNNGFQVFDDYLTGESYIFRNDSSFYW